MVIFLGLPGVTVDKAPFWTQWDFWVAVFTLALVVSTIWLAVEARKTLIESRLSSERQLRAYVGPIETNMTSFSDNNYAGAVVRVRNYGQTPAHGLKGWIGMACVPFPPREDDLPSPPSDYVMPSRVLGPGVDHFMRASTSRALTSQECNSVRLGQKVIIVLGCVVYRDIFDRRQTTNFRIEYGGSFGTPPDGAMTASDCGNDAT